MSLFGTSLRPKRLPSTSKIAGCGASNSRPSRFRGGPETYTALRDQDSNNHRTVRWGADGGAQSVEDLFIAALVTASSCKSCGPPNARTIGTRSSQALIRERHRQSNITTSFTRKFSSKTRPSQAHAGAAVEERQPEEATQLSASIPRQTYEDLANTYTQLWRHPRKLPPTATRQLKLPPNYLPLAPRLVLTPEQESRPPYAMRKILPPEDAEHAQQLKQLRKTLYKSGASSADRKRMWKIYNSLRQPRPRYLSDGNMRRVLQSLAWVEFKTLDNSKRYFSVLEECLGEGVQLTAAEWNTAISFAGRWVKTTSKEEVKTAVETWMRMENAGIAADNVTFNILFDVAIRAGRFALADTIFDELQARDMPLNRYFRTSAIYYAGLRRDGDAVRRAFREFVHAGEIVDTAVMNCVMLSLVRAGEAASAESVFAKMKELHATKFGREGPRNWEERKLVGIELHRTARELRMEREAHESSFFGSLYSTEEKKEEAQRAAPIHPDRRSCEILIRHHALVSGNLDRVRELITEIREGEWNVHGSVYFNIFRGFWFHGGHALPDWNRKSLEAFWSEFLEAVASPASALSADLNGDKALQSAPIELGEHVEDFEPSNEDVPPYFTPQLAIAVIYAFYKCAGAKRMLEVWRQIQDKWREISMEEKAMVEVVVSKLTLEDGMYIS